MTTLVVRMAVGAALFTVALNVVLFAWFVGVHWIEERREVADEMAHAGIAPASVRGIVRAALRGLATRGGGDALS